MPRRIREVLLVSSNYDAFILEEDGGLTEKIFLEYSELNLSSAPRFTHASSVNRALELIRDRRFDLVITVGRMENLDGYAYRKAIKDIQPQLPVALLIFDEADLKERMGTLDPEPYDGAFLWTGDTRILLAIIKLLEDEQNVQADIDTAGVQVIIVVEDSIRYYSGFLALLYTELMAQSQSLIAEGLNDIHKLMRMRLRPKILLARTYEEAREYYKTYRENVMALISDIRFPRSGELDPEAGLRLAAKVRERDSDLPILLQSSDESFRGRASQLRALWANKNSHHFRDRIRNFLLESLGFGPFIFRLPDRTEVARADNMFEMEQVLRALPARSLAYHAADHHISMWLKARSMFRLAKEVRQQSVEDFPDIESLRAYILELLHSARIQVQKGLIEDFAAYHTGPHSHFVRVGKASIGGKGRGIAFIHSMLARQDLAARFPEIEIKIPRTVVIDTGEFSRFMDTDGLRNRILATEDDREVVGRCLSVPLSERLKRDLALASQNMTGPLAVRSSSLLEDSQFIPFAGIYNTYMLPNNHPDKDVRFHELCQAIKAVYASTFSQNARKYIAGTPYSLDDEQMTVVIQEVVGRRFGNRYYPIISGVAMSYNYYPIGPQNPEDGVALLALGLGHTVVHGGSALRFSPSTPHILPQFTSPRDMLKHGQTNFYALDLSRTTVDFLAGAESSLLNCNLAEAEKDGSFAFVGSVYSPEDDMVRENLTKPGPRVVTFNPILKWKEIPLAPALDELLKIFRSDMGRPVEIEIAVDMGDRGRNVPRGHDPRKPTLYVLQIRPLATQTPQEMVEPKDVPQEQLLCRTHQSLGHGMVDDICDVVYVRRDDLDHLTTPKVAEQIGEFNDRLKSQRRPYLLIGPGRWGSSDPSLGIPVEWSQITGVRVLIETNFGDRFVEPSMGTHFFKNITSRQIGYLTFSAAPGQSKAGNGNDFIDLKWLDGQESEHETKDVRQVRFAEPIKVYMDGREGRALVLKPEA